MIRHRLLFALKVAVGMLVACGWIYVAIGVSNYEMSGRPSLEELKGVYQAIPTLSLTREGREWTSDKWAGMGSGETYYSSEPPEAIWRYYNDIAEHRSWIIRSNRVNDGRYVAHYCVGNSSFDIYVRKEGGVSRVEVSAGWTANPEVIGYCRMINSE